MTDTDPVVSRRFENAERFGEKAALIAGSSRISYAELVARVQSVAETWRAQGMERGDAVILAAASTPTFVFGYFAAHLLGVRAIPIDPGTPHQRLAFIADRVRPKAVYLPGTARAGAAGVDVRPLDELETTARSSGNFTCPEPDDVADIVFTTGTTGAPKGVILSHRNISAAAYSINRFIGNSESDREVLPLPLSLSFGLGRLRSVTSIGGTLILVDGFTFPDRIFDALMAEQATGLCFVPAGLAILLRFSGDRLGDFADQLAYIEIGSAPMPLDHKKALIQLLPKTRICMHYGLTEASRSAFIEFHTDKDHLESIGRPSPGVQLRITGPDGQEAPVDETGEIWVRGDHVMQGYWRGETETAEAVRGGWLRTGDLGFRDVAGYFHLRGRQKELINVGGRKVIPAEVEALLADHEAIAECACVGVPDPGGLSGEAVKAFLVPRGDARPLPRELGRYLHGRLEPYKIPTLYEWVSSIPRTGSGKIQRQLLKQPADA